MGLNMLPSSNYSEDLIENIFFRALVDDHKDIYKLVQDQCLLLCIPCAISLSPDQIITQEFIESHIFIETNNKLFECLRNRSKKIKVTNKSIQKLEGYDDTLDTIKIHFEEAFYNPKYEQYNVLCLEFPLEDKYNKVPIGYHDPNSYEFYSFTLGKTVKLSEINTLTLCKEYLFSFPENEIVLKKLAISILDITEKFKKGNEHELVKDIVKFVEIGIESLLCANIDFRDMQDRPSILKHLEIIIETYVEILIVEIVSKNIRWMIGTAYYYLMRQLCRMFEVIDYELYQEMLSNQALTMNHLNIRKEMICDFSGAIYELSTSLEKAMTPLEKLFVLKTVIELITTQIEKSFEKNNIKASDELSITSDEIIPIIVFVLIQSKHRYLHSQLFFIQNFVSPNLSKSELAYNLTTFIAASEYIRTGRLAKTLNKVSSLNVTKSNNVITDSTYVNPPRYTSHSRQISTGRSFGGDKKSSKK